MKKLIYCTIFFLLTTPFAYAKRSTQTPFKKGHPKSWVCLERMEVLQRIAGEEDDVGIASLGNCMDNNMEYSINLKYFVTPTQRFNLQYATKENCKKAMAVLIAEARENKHMKVKFTNFCKYELTRFLNGSHDTDEIWVDGYYTYHLGGKLIIKKPKRK